MTVSPMAVDYSVVPLAAAGAGIGLDRPFTAGAVPAVDWSQVGVAETATVAMDSVVRFAPAPRAPEADPWVTPAAPEPAAFGVRFEVWALRPITHQPLAQFVTAKVGRYGESWDGGQADVTVSVWDPAWSIVGDLDAFDVAIGIVGQAAIEWSGLCDQPIDIGDDQVRLALSSPMSILDQNGLGAVEQPDFYNGAGRFNGGGDGWAVVDEPEHGMESPLISVGVSGFRPWEGSGCLEVQGVGWFAGPWVRLDGHPGRVRHPQGSAMLRCPSGALGIETQVKDGAGEYVRPDFARSNARSVDADAGWQGLVATKGWLPGEGGMARIAGYVASKDKCHVDFARITWGTLSGSTVPRPLSDYPAIVMGDAQNTAMGGHPYGLAVSVDSPVVAQATLAWAHHDQHPIGELLRGIAEMYGGPDIWIDHRWTVRVAARRGTFRADVILDNDTVLMPRWAHDPGAKITELIGLTEFGTGATRAAVGAAMGTSGYNRRQTTQVPAGMSYDTASDWIDGLAGTAGQPQRTASLEVPWRVAAALEVGDTVQVALRHGRLFWSGWVRVYRRMKDPDTLTGTIDVGLDGAV